MSTTVTTAGASGVGRRLGEHGAGSTGRHGATTAESPRPLGHGR